VQERSVSFTFYRLRHITLFHLLSHTYPRRRQPYMSRAVPCTYFIPLTPTLRPWQCLGERSLFSSQHPCRRPHFVLPRARSCLVVIYCTSLLHVGHLFCKYTASCQHAMCTGIIMVCLIMIVRLLSFPCVFVCLVKRVKKRGLPLPQSRSRDPARSSSSAFAPT
jgi:hypothetical protein